MSPGRKSAVCAFGPARVSDRQQGIRSHLRTSVRERVARVELGVARLDGERATLRHGIACVHTQIHEDLIELRGIRQHRMQRVERPVAGRGNRNRRPHRKQRRERTLLLGAGVEAALQKACISAEEPLHAVAPLECAPLLQSERNQDGDEIHGLRIISEIL